MARHTAANPARWIDPTGLDVGASRVLSPEDRVKEDNGAAIIADDPYDIVRNIARLEKPGAVIELWNGLDDESESRPLSNLEKRFASRLGVEVVGSGVLNDPELARATRRGIVTRYVKSHPSFKPFMLGEYRLGRDVNPLQLALERGWQIMTGREMFTEEKVARKAAAFDLATAPDLGFDVIDPDGESLPWRVHVEYDRSTSPRGAGHETRIKSNDPKTITLLKVAN
jgi:hypothetical protein